MLATATGCVSSGPAGDDSAEGGGGDAALAAAFPVYVTENPITIEDIPDSEFSEMNSGWARVTGLADDAVTQKINDRLYEKYEELKHSDPPPYRGLRALIPEGMEPESEWINFMTFGNINNILSVDYIHTRRYLFPGEDGDASLAQKDEPPILRTAVVTEEHPLNFNLITGDEITLADLFGDGPNAFKAIDDAVLSVLRDSPDYYTREDYISMLPRDYPGFTLIGSYAPIDESQKFLISESGLNIVIDYETPQYVMDRMTGIRLSVPLTELGEAGAAAIERFTLPEEDTAALYEADAPLLRRMFIHRMSKPSADSLLPTDYRRDFDGIELHGIIAGPCETTPEFEKLLLDMLIVGDDEREDLREMRVKRDASGPGIAGEPLQAYMNIYFERYGNVFSVQRLLHASFTDASNDDEHKDIGYYRESRRSFDAISLAPLDPEDIFIDGFDYKGPLREALNE
jgi:hypothetical protein